MKYVAVGFKVDKPISLFYYKTSNLDNFIRNLKLNIEKHKPDFVSLRMVREP